MYSSYWRCSETVGGSVKLSTYLEQNHCRMKQKMQNNMGKTLEEAVSFPLPHGVIQGSFLSLWPSWCWICKLVLLNQKFVQKSKKWLHGELQCPRPIQRVGLFWETWWENKLKKSGKKVARNRKRILKFLWLEGRYSKAESRRRVLGPTFWDLHFACLPVLQESFPLQCI